MRIGTLSIGLAVFLACDVAAQPRPRRLAFEEMRFPDKDLGEKFKRFHAAAEKMAGPKWERLPFESRGEYRGRGFYFGEWCSFREDDRSGPFNYHGPNELTCVQLGAAYFVDEKDPDHLRKIIGMTLHSRWKPADFGWNAHVDYTSFNARPDPATTGHNEYLHIHWHFQPSAKHKTWPAAVELHRYGHAALALPLTSGGTNYMIIVHTKTAPWKPRVPDPEVLRLLASPETLRDQLLADHEELRKAVRATIASGGGIYSAFYDRPVLPGQKPEAPVHSTRPLSDADKEEILKQAEANIGARIASVKGHFKELHAAARKAFPIRECLIEARRP
jgi:hypothetical protein